MLSFPRAPSTLRPGLTLTHKTDNRDDLQLRRYEDGSWTCEAVVRAFCKRAALATQLINCCTELMFEEALSQARDLDRWYADTGEFVGPL